ncbi:unnamed protein product [Penicillium olsonii]|uniref:Uncharacterized protein n=1 Tax=Penicillium olsonii TaxID=99116 RepID=A0A9W4I3F0_PENOL|nr:unnamed protein product [Penicillium olsonii]CAG8132360.1 unnamed protein product [Penicillium olsonii]CAG8212067.1 unnamed protein product [Penicillium olsonii]
MTIESRKSLKFRRSAVGPIKPDRLKIRGRIIAAPYRLYCALHFWASSASSQFAPIYFTFTFSGQYRLRTHLHKRDCQENHISAFLSQPDLLNAFMNRYRNAPTLRGPSKASATTLCQKCLKRDIYECKASAQERPYIPRPSRTQQLLNPKLVPKLSTENPNELLRTEGLADELLAGREEERGRKRDLEAATDRHGISPKRARSISSHSMSSISTISTNRSYSASPRRGRNETHDSHHRDVSASPGPAKTRKRRYSDSSEGRSGSAHSGPAHHSPPREQNSDRNTRRRRRESSPEQRGRNRGEGRHSERRHRRSRSADKDRLPKERRSLTPDAPRNRDRPYRDRASPPRQAPAGSSGQETKSRANQPRERSLSPFSKRLALTQAMNVGR